MRLQRLKQMLWRKIQKAMRLIFRLVYVFFPMYIYVKQ